MRKMQTTTCRMVTRVINGVHLSWMSARKPFAVCFDGPPDQRGGCGGPVF
jgi:hypothetical protein